MQCTKMTRIKKTTPGAGEDVVKLETSCIATRNVKGAATLGNSLTIFQNLPYDPEIPLPGIIPREFCLPVLLQSQHLSPYL